MKKNTVITIATQVILLSIIFLLLVGTRGFIIKNGSLDRITTITDVTATVDGETRDISLPYSFNNLQPRTPVTISATIKPIASDVIYIKSVYSPGKIYVNDRLIYEFGDLDNYPSFMVDPATEVNMASLGNITGKATLRMEFLSPLARDALNIQPPILGNVKEVFADRAKALGMPFILSTMQLIIGVLLILTSVFVIFFEKKGIVFFWLGMFSLATGAWAFGECNFTGMLIKNPTLLYCLAFMGLFTFPIPLLHFARNAINFKNEKPILYMAVFMTAASYTALILQLLGKVPFSKSMYLFHFLVPIALCSLAVIMAYEWIHYKEIDAKRFMFPIGVLALSSLLEVLNYKIHFTYMFASLFQIGIIFFVLCTGIIGGLYIKDMINLKDQKRKLAFEVSLMEIQVAEQKKHNLIIVENAEKLKQQRHDLRHQLSVINSLADEDNDSLKEFINSLIEAIPPSPKDYCDNKAINAIVSRYVTICAEQDIECTINLNVPEHNEQMTDSNLSVIFGNLLENAVEACGRMSEGHKFVRLNSSLQYDMLAITMDNSFDGRLRKENSKFYSRKRDDFGIGLSSIQSVARNGNGDACFEDDGLVFHSSVYVRL